MAAEMEDLEWRLDNACCMMRFAGPDWPGPDVLHEGYTNDATPDRASGDHWVCDECFALLASALGWTSPDAPSSTDR